MGAPKTHQNSQAWAQSTHRPFSRMSLDARRVRTGSSLSLSEPQWGLRSRARRASRKSATSPPRCNGASVWLEFLPRVSESKNPHRIISDAVLFYNNNIHTKEGCAHLYLNDGGDDGEFCLKGTNLRVSIPVILRVSNPTENSEGACWVFGQTHLPATDGLLPAVYRGEKFLQSFVLK